MEASLSKSLCIYENVLCPKLWTASFVFACHTPDT
jgi:hypothetical protein